MKKLSSIITLIICSMIYAQVDSTQQRVIKSISEGQNTKNNSDVNTSQPSVQYPVLSTNKPISNEKKGDWVIGGNLGASFGNTTSIIVAPTIGYRLKNGFEFGGSVGYNYYNDDNDGFNEYTSNFGNVGPYISYNISSIYAKAEYQYLFGSRKYDFTSNSNFSEDISESALWLGGGYQQRIAGAAALRIGFMYNVLYDEDKSIYGSGFIPTIGVSVGL